jgi:hypothetical protein
VLNLPPIRLETLLDSCYKEEVEGGYDVPIPLLPHANNYSIYRDYLI